MQPFLHITWNPSNTIPGSHIPWIDRPIAWYGLLFAFGIYLTYQIFLRTLTKRIAESGGGDQFKNNVCDSPKKIASRLSEKLMFYGIIGGVVGARLGDIIFYQDLAWYLKHPLEILKTWKGGLASHGGAVGLFVALYFYWRRYRNEFPTTSFFGFTDLLTAPVMITCGSIRIGNFINQEILGHPTAFFTGIFFGAPFDGAIPGVYHPVQLYESIGYFTFFIFFTLLRPRQAGMKTALFLILVPGFRFAIEFLKSEQSVHISGGAFLTMGHYLTVPFILLGLFLLIFYTARKPSIQRET